MAHQHVGHEYSLRRVIGSQVKDNIGSDGVDALAKVLDGAVFHRQLADIVPDSGRGAAFGSTDGESIQIDRHR